MDKLSLWIGLLSLPKGYSVNNVNDSNNVLVGVQTKEDMLSMCYISGKVGGKLENAFFTVAM